MPVQRRNQATAYTKNQGESVLSDGLELEKETGGVSVAEIAAVAKELDAMEGGRFPQLARALRNPNFRLFWSGNFLSNIGTWMQNVAQGWLVLLLTRNSAFWLGVVGFAGSIPFLFFTLFGGVIADRVNKRRLLIMTQTAMMLLAFILFSIVAQILPRRVA